MKKFNRWFWISPLFLGCIVLAGIRLVSDTSTGYKFWERPIMLNLTELGFAIGTNYIVQFIMFYFLRRSSKRTEKLNLKMLLLEYLIILLVGIVVINPSIAIIHYITNEPPRLADFVIASVIFSMLLIIVYSIFRGRQLLNAYFDQKLQTERVKNIQIETELKFLKAQFHPHFLFNALNTIYFQIDEKNEKPRKTIEQLSELLRYQLYDINQSVCIIQELNFILTYIDLQKVRMKETLQLDISFDPCLKEQKIQALLLFPLIENAFKYVGGDYWIKIESLLDGNKLLFEVKNAIPQQVDATNLKKSGIGLESLKRRLELLYPGKHKLVLSKTSDSYIANLMIEL
jgi:sensor histidine kinase YesM